jgi:hypothetical protein
MRLPLVHLLLIASAGLGDDVWNDLPNSIVQTSKGPLVVDRAPAGAGYNVRLAGKNVEGLDADGASASLSDLIRAGSHELVVIAVYSGGTACPAQYAVLEISPSPHVSERFGTCNPAVRLTPGKGSLTISMPGYFANPEVLSDSERRKIAARVDTFVWSNGKVHQVNHAP